MQIFRVLSFVCGFVEFEAKGGFPERFINLCASRSIPISHVEMSETGLAAQVPAKKFMLLLPVARLSGMKISVRRKAGLPFFIRQNRHRVGLLIGAACFIFLFALWSGFIWSVQVVPNEGVCSEDVLKAAKDCGLYVGTRIKLLDAEQVQNEAMIKLSGKVAWLSVNIKGSKAVIETREYKKWREDGSYGEPSNLVADCDGVVLSVLVHNGQKAVSEGSAVKKGDLLISGMAENRDGSTQFMDAAGTVTALRERSIKKTEKTGEAEKMYAKTKCVKALYLWGLELPFGKLSKEKSSAIFESRKFMEYRGTAMPLGIVTRWQVEYIEKQQPGEKALLEAFDAFTNARQGQYKNSFMLKSKVKVTAENSQIKITSKDSTIDFLGEKQKISFK